MKLVVIDTKYIDYLRGFDKRVCYNKDKYHTRPYVGVLFKLRNVMYFAPLTSSGKSNKLKSNPKQESLIFFPIDNCNLGGVNINNMIPVVEGVYNSVDMGIEESDSLENVKYKRMLVEQLKFLSINEKKLRTKANILYNMKIKKQLSENRDLVVCDFRLLEEKSLLFINK